MKGGRVLMQEYFCIKRRFHQAINQVLAEGEQEEQVEDQKYVILSILNDLVTPEANKSEEDIFQNLSFSKILAETERPNIIKQFRRKS